MAKKKIKPVAIIVSKFNEEITNGLLEGALATFDKNGFDKRNIKIFYCPGAFEIPFVAKKLCRKKKYSAIICLGAVIKGETAHFEFISFAVSKGIQQVMLEFEIPISFGVLTTYTVEQAKARSSNDENNKGREAALSAIELLKMKL